MKKKYIFIAFIVVAIIQMLIPLSMVFEQELILATGQPYNFKTEPIDPNDPFRGKYIILNYNINRYGENIEKWEVNEGVYVYLKNDSLGFAQIDTISKKIIASKADYVIANVSWLSDYDSTVHFDFPFDRFYMEESKAKPAEDLFSFRSDSLQSHALIYVRKGKGIIKDVYINNIPIATYLEK